MSDAHSVTMLLRAWREGAEGAFDELLPLVDRELKRIARGRLGTLRRCLARNGEVPLLDTGALINESYLRLVGDTRDWQNRAHFFAIAALRMRNICRDYARRASAEKRGAGARRVGLEEAGCLPADGRLSPEGLLDLTLALDQLEALDRRQAQIVELKYFGGLTDIESAEVLGVSRATVKRDWCLARAWLYRAIAGHSACE